MYVFFIHAFNLPIRVAIPLQFTSMPVYIADTLSPGMPGSLNRAMLSGASVGHRA